VAHVRRLEQRAPRLRSKAQWLLRRSALLPGAPQEAGGQRRAEPAIRGDLHPVAIAAFLVAVL